MRQRTEVVDRSQRHSKEKGRDSQESRTARTETELKKTKVRKMIQEGRTGQTQVQRTVKTRTVREREKDKFNKLIKDSGGQQERTCDEEDAD